MSLAPLLSAPLYLLFNFHCQACQLFTHQHLVGQFIISKLLVSLCFLGLVATPHFSVREEKESQSNFTLQSSTSSSVSILGSTSEPKEYNYMGLSDCSSSVDSSAITTASAESRSNLNLKATELRLGLPGSQSPDRDDEFGLLNSTKHHEKSLLPSHPLRNGTSCISQKSIASGNKRGLSDAMTSFSEENYNSSSDINVVLSPRCSSNLAVKFYPMKECPASLTSKVKEGATPNAIQEKPHDARETNRKDMSASSGPTPKAQVVGWPPIRSFRKNSLATTSKNAGEQDGKARLGALYVKVSMDGAPYLRKVDLKACTTYQELSSALETMFSCFTIGQCASDVTAGREMLSESKLMNLVHGSEYALTYEDKDGDWMLVGDVPWEMFIGTCKRLRIMKSSDAIGLAPRAIEKCRSRS